MIHLQEIDASTVPTPAANTMTIFVDDSDGKIKVKKSDGSVVNLEVAASGSDAHYTHNQSTVATSWSVTHNLGKKPTVSIVDTNDSEVIGTVQYIDNNSLVITLQQAYAGKAYCN